jgi:hypothetical protein
MSSTNKPTDPYGHLEFAIGTDDDFHCFDYAELPNGQVKLHAVINSETGSFIQDGSVNTVDKCDAPQVALGMIDDALEWLEEDEHDLDGWNQDPYYFYRAVKAFCEGKSQLIERKIPDYNPPAAEPDRKFEENHGIG